MALPPSDGLPPVPRAPSIPDMAELLGGRAATSIRPSGADPSVLVVGAGQAMQEGIRAALRERRIFSHTVSADAAVECVRAAAPDLVLLVGDAAVDGGKAVLAGLAASPMTSVVPVAILSDESALGERLRAFRHGATAVIPRSASVDDMAARVEKLVREIPEREGAALGNVGEATLRELVETLGRELRTGILSVRGASGVDEDAVRLVLGGGRPLADAIDEFVKRLGTHVVHAEALHYEFEERAAGTVQLLATDLMGDGDGVVDVTGVRIVLVDDQSARADSIAQELRARGAQVIVSDLFPADMHFARLRQLDPTMILIGEPTLHSRGAYSLLKRMRHDARLRWASLLVVRWEELWAAATETPNLAGLLPTVAELAYPERDLVERARAGHPFDVRLETMGPARLIRVLATCPRTLRATIYNPRVALQIDVADGTVVSASGHTHADSAHQFDGITALAALMVLSSGRVRVEAEEHVGNPNVMSTADVALNMADAVESPIAPSLPPPGATISGGPPPARGEHRRKSGWGLLYAGAALGAVAVVGAAILLTTRNSPSRPAASSATTASSAPAEVGAPAPVASVAVALRPASVPSGASADGGAAPLSGAEVGARPSPVPAGLVEETATATPSCAALAGALESLSGDAATKESAIAMKNARRALMRGDLATAQASLCRAAKLAPGEAEPLNLLTRVLLMQRDGAQAVTIARDGVKAFPGDDSLRAFYGDALARTGDVAGATAAWLDATRTSKDDRVEIKRLAQRFYRAAIEGTSASEHERAERFYRRVLFIDPEYPLAAAGLARSLFWLKDFDAAIRWANRSLALTPDDMSVHLLLGDAHVEKGERTEAEKHYVEAQRLGPGSDAARRGLARVRSR